MKLVIVESPAKAKTINTYLGKDYEVLASFGHVRDLPAKDGSVRPDEDFAMDWEVDPASRKRLSDIAGALKNADELILATDPDREGEAISWHVLDVLKQKKALKGEKPITARPGSLLKDAVLKAARREAEAKIGRKLSEFEFASHLDGSRRLLTPEESMRVQGLLGSDIALQLDICPPANVDRSVLVAAVERTTRWAERCLQARVGGQGLFGIIQGGTDVELRLRHAEALGRLPLDGLALGGFSLTWQHVGTLLFAAVAIGALVQVARRDDMRGVLLASLLGLGREDHLELTGSRVGDGDSGHGQAPTDRGG